MASNFTQLSRPTPSLINAYDNEPSFLWDINMNVIEENELAWANCPIRIRAQKEVLMMVFTAIVRKTGQVIKYFPEIDNHSANCTTNLRQ